MANIRNSLLARDRSEVSSIPLSTSMNAPDMSPCVMSSLSPHISSSDSSSTHLNSLSSSESSGMKTPFSTLNNIRRDTSLIGQTVRIYQGHYKGYVGIVKVATESIRKKTFMVKVKQLLLIEIALCQQRLFFFFILINN
jgi:hypothetical protein